jgi:hypothetical protein
MFSCGVSMVAFCAMFPKGNWCGLGPTGCRTGLAGDEISPRVLMALISAILFTDLRAPSKCC